MEESTIQNYQDDRALTMHIKSASCSYYCCKEKLMQEEVNRQKKNNLSSQELQDRKLASNARLIQKNLHFSIRSISLKTFKSQDGAIKGQNYYIICKWANKIASHPSYRQFSKRYFHNCVG